jgi:ketosteroid isomerase-like protein
VPGLGEAHKILPSRIVGSHCHDQRTLIPKGRKAFRDEPEHLRSSPIALTARVRRCLNEIASPRQLNRYALKKRARESVINQGELSMRRTIVMAVLVLTTGSIALGQGPRARGDRRKSIEQVIRQLDHERIQAQIESDAAALERIYAADFIGVGPSGAVRTKPQVISDFTSGELKFQSITTDEVHVRIYGNTAVETGRSTMNGQDRGKAVPRDNRFTRVWVKQQGHWRLVLNHYSPLIMQQ